MPDFKTMFTELGEYFSEKYFSPDLSNVVNFDATEVERFLPFLIVGICAGIFIAACIFYSTCDFLGRPVRKLYKANAFSEESAKTLDEIGCNRFFIRKNLASASVLSKYVKSCTPLTSKNDAKAARFYLEEETRYVADKRFKPLRGGIRTLVLLFFLCTALCFSLLYFTPDVIQLADNAIGMLKDLI